MAEKREFEDYPRKGEHWTREQFKALIAYGIEQNISDIKFITDMPPYIRVYGRWIAVCPVILTDDDLLQMIIWTNGNEGIGARLATCEYANYASVIPLSRAVNKRFRCNATACEARTRSGMSLVMRLIPDIIPSTASVEMEDYILENLFPEQGLVLITGPTGSGKSTLLAAAIGHARRTMPYRSLETYEDPIEFDYSVLNDDDGMPLGPLCQFEIGRHIRDYESIAPNAARRSSDIVLVGESKDKDSFLGVIQLSDMGMLTFSTMHTRSVAETPSRVLNTFSESERHEVKASLIHGLRFIVQQRLLPTPEGKRVAVREWLRFGEALRQELSDLPMTQLIPRIHQEVKARGHLLIDDVRAKWKNGRITKEAYQLMESEYEDIKNAVER